MQDDGDPIGDLVNEIAQKHQILVSRDDPILMVYTLNKRLMDTTAKAQESILLQYRKEMNELALKYEKQLSAQSEKALALTLAVTQETISKSMKLETEAARQKFQHMANVNLVGSVLTLAAAAVVLWATLGN